MSTEYIIMPKYEIDYSNTVIYKIYCKDTSITDIYVGHTTNFEKRKLSHQNACKMLSNDSKIYNAIRSNGGWENWDMVEIAKYFCKNITEAKIKEQYHYEELNCSLNSIKPYLDKTNYFCNYCNLQCIGPKQYTKHNKCNKHIQNLNKNESVADEKNDNECVSDEKKKYCEKSDEKKKYCEKKYCCEICKFNTYKLTDYNRHLITKKHILNKTAQSVESHNNKTDYICEKCNKKYSDRTGLWRHNKICTVQNTSKEEPTNAELIKTLIEKQNELLNKFTEIIQIQTKLNERNLESLQNN
jgi:hypothetical protein